jgi:hypothetical protein
MMKYSALLVFLPAFLPFVLTGCGGDHATVVIEPYEPLQDIARMVDRCVNTKKKPPARLQDLSPYEPEGPIGHRALIKGACVLIYGVGISPQAGDKVLAYDKDAPTQGGYVLMQDGTVKKMTAVEFQSATMAKP